jgi:hypothetical protein
MNPIDPLQPNFNSTNFNANPGQTMPNSNNFNAPGYSPMPDPNNFNMPTTFTTGTNMNTFDPNCTTCAGSGYFYNNSMRQSCQCGMGNYSSAGNINPGANMYATPQYRYRQF